MQDGKQPYSRYERQTMPTIPHTMPQPITPRHWHFEQAARPARWWLGGDPVASAWHNALSCSFPRGEAYFIESLAQARLNAPEPLAGQIRAFIAQEAAHAQAHRAFNGHVAASGYDLGAIDRRLAAFIAAHRSSWPVLNIAATMALEHLTAILAAEVLTNTRAYAGADPAVMALWRWHAAEEIEHKGVAFDAWAHVTAGWAPLRRWRLRVLAMAVVTRNFLRERSQDATDLLAQDGITGARAKWRLAAYLLGPRGMVWRMAPGWLRFFKPGFHPWHKDDLKLAQAALAWPEVAACAQPPARRAQAA